MNPAWYFEEDPWTQAAGEVRAGGLGRVVAASVQAVCAPGDLDATVGLWRSRLADLLGAPLSLDERRVSGAVSILARHPGDVIVRVFADEGPGEPVACFEIVGADGLLVWKPDVRPLSVLRTADGCEVCCEHAYAAGLDAAGGAASRGGRTADAGL